MKKILAIILLTATLITMASCSLVRKLNPDGDSKETKKPAADSETYATDFSDTVPESEPVEPVKYTEEDAFELISNSFPDYDEDHIKIERTGNVVAQNDGTEYFIFNVSLAKPAETAAEPETDENGNDVTEEEVIEFEPETKYYVSVNGVVVTQIADDNIDTGYVKEKFYKKYGETDSETGAKYILIYRGVMRDGDNLCYNFAVFTENSGDEAKEIYQFNYLVTVDGKYNAEAVLES